MTEGASSDRRRRVVILLENLPVQRDRRVWRQARALVEAGMAVTVICPADEPSGRRRFGLHRPLVVDDVEIRAFNPARERQGPLGFVWEYALAWLQMTRALAACRRCHRVDGIQACNPPDIFFPHAWWARWNGVPFVFDQHDLTPELFETRFGPLRAGWSRLLHRVLIWCERATYRGAARVIATNQSYRWEAVDRGRVPPDDVVVVRNGPDPTVMRPRPVTTVRRPAQRHLVVWMGNMGPQDGVDDAVRSVAHLVHAMGRRDVHVVFIGHGEVLEQVRDLARALRVGDQVTFTGWIPDDEAFQWLSAASIGLSADPPGPLNDKSTMNKTLEYMSFGLPVVAHDLHETRVSAGPAAVYAETGDPAGLARCVDRLLRDPELMATMGRIGRQRIEDHLSWPHQTGIYVELWASLLGLGPSARPEAEAEDDSTSDDHPTDHSLATP
ncbi:MAG: glycosyltransferase family 4 protein [Acidimicrobiales bacterium]